MLGFERSGTVQIPWAIGDAKAAFRGFAEAVAAVIPGAVSYETPKMWRVGRGGPRTTKLYDRRSDEITLDEVEKISL